MQKYHIYKFEHYCGMIASYLSVTSMRFKSMYLSQGELNFINQNFDPKQ